MADIEATSWQDIEAESGLTRDELANVADAYAKAKSTIITYGMGVTQHNKGTANVRLICDLLLMRGNMGREGGGICPLRGHSNVQGNRTVGITEKPSRHSSRRSRRYSASGHPRSMATTQSRPCRR